jgi:glutamyl-tRNA reductase
VHLFLLGVSHRTAPVDLRERLDFSSGDLSAAAEAITARPSMSESVVLSTCNRSEIYTATSDPSRARDELVTFLSDYHHVAPQAFQPHLFALENSAAVAHLFRVAAGLDSLVVGEPQILGQVKDAYQTAAGKRCVGPVLSNVFRWSFGVGKRVRTETALGEGAVSVSYAAVALARKIFGRLQGRRVLVVGAGDISSLTAQHLRAQGVGEIVIASRTHANAEALAHDVGGLAVPWEQMISALGSADIVITATGSQRPIIMRAQLEAAKGHRRSTPLFIIDLAVPRDVDPAASEIEQVFLYNIDDLQSIVDENMSKRAAEIERAESIVNEEVTRFMTWQRSRSAVPTIVALRQRFESIRSSELQRLEGKLGAIPPETRSRVDEVTRLIVEKLLIEPTEQLKALPDEETQAAYTEAINRLFRLQQDEESLDSARGKPAERP